jgi:hypothetical protein
VLLRRGEVSYHVHVGRLVVGVGVARSSKVLKKIRKEKIKTKS